MGSESRLKRPDSVRDCPVFSFVIFRNIPQEGNTAAWNFVSEDENTVIYCYFQILSEAVCVNLPVWDMFWTKHEDCVKHSLLRAVSGGPVTIKMDDYSGFEKVGSLGRNLTTSNIQTTTSAGDIVLYNGSNIVMFYGSNS